MEVMQIDMQVTMQIVVQEQIQEVVDLVQEMVDQAGFMLNYLHLIILLNLVALCLPVEITQ